MGSPEFNPTSPLYTLHSGRPIRLQILIPNTQSAVAAVYTLDLRSLAPHSATPSIHQQNLRVTPAPTLPYLELQLPPDALPAGPYAGELRSPTGAYALHFSISTSTR
jgi:hypothetical protein